MNLRASKRPRAFEPQAARAIGAGVRGQGPGARKAERFIVRDDGKTYPDCASAAAAVGRSLKRVLNATRTTHPAGGHRFYWSDDRDLPPGLVATMEES